MRYGVVGNTALKRPVRPVTENRPAQNGLRYGTCGKNTPKMNLANKTELSKKKVKTNAGPKARTIDPEVLKQIKKEEKVIKNKFRKANILKVFLAVFFITLIALPFWGILKREAGLLQLHYSNVRLENEIKEINEDISNLSEELVKLYDPDLIKEIAIRDMQMRKPAASQIISIKMPTTDRIFTDYEESSILDNSLDKYFENLEGFFKTLR